MSESDRETYKRIKADPARWQHLLEVKRSYQRTHPRKTANFVDWAKSKREWRAKNHSRNLELKRAHRAVACALESGNLVRPEFCQLCWGVCRPEAHHYLGYAVENKLDIVWLCVHCHAKQHMTGKGPRVTVQSFSA